MKATMRIGAACVAMAVAMAAQAGSAVEPASVTVTNFRGEAIQQVSALEFYRGTTLRFTNCVVFAGADTNSSVQGLSNVTVQVMIGNVTTSDTYTATINSAALGKWSADVSVPTYTPTIYLQLKLTDENTNSFIYPWKTVNTKASL